MRKIIQCAFYLEDNMRIAICDDDKDYRDFLINHINFYFNDKHIPYQCEDFSCGEDLLASNSKFDIVFLDIEMRAVNGIKVTEKLNEANRNTIIFIVTSFNNYLDDAMDLKVFRFIDKKLISSQRIYSGLDKALEQINRGEILIRTATGDVIRIDKNDIMYVEVRKRETTIVTVNNCYISHETLTFFKEQLVSNCFVIPHNSYIVNLNYVSKYQRSELTTRNGARIFISQKRQPDIRRIFFAFTMED